ncbi:MAG: nitrogenase iron-molybdenum cofactor biosynthesis protein NifN, partial [Desulfuromonadaceae bacterium]|nr:nitrogenase iron-molybdenum cofactor biosynthesis protein NifN [Desulfuromonadaceae bacterium]
KQAALSTGGTPIDEIRALASATLVFSVGDSMQQPARALLKKNPALKHHHFHHLSGLQATDQLIECLLKESGRQPSPSLVRWRKRLQDALLDSHFSIGQTRFALAAEPDQLAGLAAAVREAGGRVALAVSSVASPQLERLEAERVMVGDLEDAEDLAEHYDVIIGSFHCEALAHRLHKGLVLRGFPNWEQVGNQLKNDVLYEGSAYFLFECANSANHCRHQLAV